MSDKVLRLLDELRREIERKSEGIWLRGLTLKRVADDRALLSTKDGLPLIANCRNTGYITSLTPGCIVDVLVESQGAFSPIIKDFVVVAPHASERTMTIEPTGVDGEFVSHTVPDSENPAEVHRAGVASNWCRVHLGISKGWPLLVAMDEAETKIFRVVLQSEIIELTRLAQESAE